MSLDKLKDIATTTALAQGSFDEAEAIHVFRAWHDNSTQRHSG